MKVSLGTLLPNQARDIPQQASAAAPGDLVDSWGKGIDPHCGSPMKMLEGILNLGIPGTFRRWGRPCARLSNFSNHFATL